MRAASYAARVTELISIVVGVPDDEVDVVSGLVWATGAADGGAPSVAGVEERVAGDRKALLVVSLPADAVAGVLAALGGRWPLEVTGPLDDRSWWDAWRPWARAAEVGRVVVRPPWVDHDLPPGAVEVVVDPGRAFGSGAHVTTQLVLAALQDRDLQGRAVLDVGCGSGVLAVAAARLGAGRVVGVDVDPEAVLASEANAAANGVVDPVEVHLGSVGAAPAGRFDVVVANILAPVLIDLAPAVAARVAPGGAIVLGGLLAEQAEGVAHAYAEAGAGMGVVAEQDGWVALAGPA